MYESSRAGRGEVEVVGEEGVLERFKQKTHFRFPKTSQGRGMRVSESEGGRVAVAHMGWEVVHSEGMFGSHLIFNSCIDVRPARLVKRWEAPSAPISFSLQERAVAGSGRQKWEINKLSLNAGTPTPAHHTHSHTDTPRLGVPEPQDMIIMISMTSDLVDTLRFS
jgi:hypothetical protein